jgi:hypothetical protein
MQLEDEDGSPLHQKLAPSKLFNCTEISALPTITVMRPTTSILRKKMYTFEIHSLKKDFHSEFFMSKGEN